MKPFAHRLACALGILVALGVLAFLATVGALMTVIFPCIIGGWVATSLFLAAKGETSSAIISLLAAIALTTAFYKSL